MKFFLDHSFFSKLVTLNMSCWALTFDNVIPIISELPPSRSYISSPRWDHLLCQHHISSKFTLFCFIMITPHFWQSKCLLVSSCPALQHLTKISFLFDTKLTLHMCCVFLYYITSSKTLILSSHATSDQFSSNFSQCYVNFLWSSRHVLYNSLLNQSSFLMLCINLLPSLICLTLHFYQGSFCFLFYSFNIAPLTNFLTSSV